MAVDIKVPSVGESVTEALLAQWYKEDGDHVRKDEALFVIETDKVTLEVTAEADGVLHISVAAGETVKIGAVVGSIDTDRKVEEAPVAATAERPKKPPAAKANREAPERQDRVATETEREGAESRPDEKQVEKDRLRSAADSGGLAPSVKQLLEKHGLKAQDIPASGPDGRLTRGDVMLHLEGRKGPRSETDAPASGGPKPERAGKIAAAEVAAAPPEEAVSREPMSPLRRRIAEHLLKAKQNTAMLTTFNDIDMQAVVQARSRYREAFEARYDVPLGFMSFFVKASIAALKEFPRVNAFIEDADIVYHAYYHVGVAIGTGRGLVVPVIRHADRLSFAEMERAIVDFVDKVKNNRLTLSDLEGGTFTITNGGVFGSLLSTPILNMPQSAILGMHRIEKRAVVIDDEIVIRPMMYVALSYDHRIIDGREAVTFLRRIKECIENPERIMMEI